MISIPHLVFDKLIGLLLSDLHIARRNEIQNARLLFAQSGKPEKFEFFMLVFEMLSVFCVHGLKPTTRVWQDKLTGKAYSSISFGTMQLPCFNLLHETFYTKDGLNTVGKPKYIKIVPLYIYNLLTSAGLAFWIMGDGSRQNEGIHLSVYACSEIECELLISVLTRKFNLKCSIHHHVKGPRLYIDKASTIIVRELVKPYMVPSMLYKLGL